MTNWLTTQEIASRYVVGERALLRFSRYGTLPRRSNEEGQLTFDEGFVSAVFRKRGSVTLVAITAPGSMGDVGSVRLGEAPGARAASADARHAAA